MSDTLNVYINPYSDAFTERLIRAQEKRDKLKEDDANDIVLSRRNNGIIYSLYNDINNDQNNIFY